MGSRAYRDVEDSPLTFDDTGRGVPSSAPLKPIATGPAPGVGLPPAARVVQVGVVADIQLP